MILELGIVDAHCMGGIVTRREWNLWATWNMMMLGLVGAYMILFNLHKFTEVYSFLYVRYTSTTVLLLFFFFNERSSMD